MSLISKPLISNPVSQPLTGKIVVPGDKSISHRAVILASIAKGVSHITDWLDAGDTRATLNACAALGAGVQWQQQDGKPVLQITGTAGRFQTPTQALDLGNSGTGVRLLLGAVAGQAIDAEFVGDESLSQRPMGRIIKPLQQMGAQFDYVGEALTDEAICLPIKSSGPQKSSASAAKLNAIEYAMPVASAQIQASILLAGLQADGVTRIHQPGACRDHSERMLRLFGADCRRESSRTLAIYPSQLEACTVQVPGDFSSAAFLLQAALLTPGSSVQLLNVGNNPTRNGLLSVVSGMQGQVGISLLPSESTVNQDFVEPRVELLARHSRLQGMDVPQPLVSNCIDEFPMIMAMAATAKGTTRVRGAAELRVKESDRIAVMVNALQQLGVQVTEYPDGADVIGGTVKGGEVDAHGDHRIAMTLAVLGLIAQQPIIIHNAQAIATSYPGFVDDMNHLGANLEWQQ